jgi:hypothetical protein
VKCSLIALFLVIGSAPAVPSVAYPVPSITLLSAQGRNPVCASDSRLVARIEIEREIQEGPYVEQWDELERALQEGGFEIGFVRQQERRYDGGLSWEDIDAVIRVGKEIADDTILVAKLIELIRRYLKGRVRIGPREDEVRVVRILGPRGETLSQVEVPEE